MSLRESDGDGTSREPSAPISALVGAASLKWRCVFGVLHDGVITLSKSLGLVVLPFWQVGKIVLW